MPESGWYPDPDQTPGRFRYWTGTAWSPATTFDPRDRPPTDGTAPHGRDQQAPDRSRRRWPVIITAVVIVAVVALVAWLVVDARSPRVSGAPDPGPTADASGWDDSSPIPTEPATPSEQPTRVASTRPVGCDQYAESQPAPQPDDGRVHGGPLSFARIDGWPPAVPTNRFPFSRDGYAQVLPLPEELPWAADAFVGISTLQGYPDGVEATDQLLQCVLTSDFYTSVDVRIAENSTRSIRISGTEAVQRDTLIRFTHPQLETTGSRLRIIIVESQPRTFYFHAISMERKDLAADVDRATASLRLD